MKGVETVILICCVLSSASTAWGQLDTLSAARRPVETVQRMTPLPSPTGALLRSTALPGWGQFYNKKPLKGSVFLILQVSLFTGVLLQRDPMQSGGLTRLGNGLLLGLIGVRVYSMADAYVDAHLADFDEPQAHGRRPESEITLGLRIRW